MMISHIKTSDPYYLFNVDLFYSIHISIGFKFQTYCYFSIIFDQSVLWKVKDRCLLVYIQHY